MWTVKGTKDAADSESDMMSCIPEQLKAKVAVQYATVSPRVL